MRGWPVSLIVVAAGAAFAQPVFPGETWEARAPEAVGLDPAVLDQFVARVGGHGCVVRGGYMVRTWGDQSLKTDWASAGKAVIATMLLFAVEEGRLAGVDDPVGAWGWAVRPEDEGLSFAQLANMTSGYARAEGPGEAWAYNDIGTKLLAVTLFDRVFGTTADEAARAEGRLGVLGFEDGTLFSSREGYGVFTTPRDMARIGWLWLNRGRWGGEQLLPGAALDAIMAPTVPGGMPRSAAGGSDYLGVGTYGGGTDQTPFGPGIYGFGWWFNGSVGAAGEIAWPDAPADTVLALGHWDREIVVVIPSLGIVAAGRGQWGSFEPGNPGAGLNATLGLLASAVVGPVCVADLNRDGALTLADFVAFRQAYVAGDLAADFDGSGELTLGDFVAFRNAYVAGCGG